MGETSIRIAKKRPSWRQATLFALAALWAAACTGGRDGDELGRDRERSLERAKPNLVPEVVQAQGPDQAIVAELEEVARREGSVPLIVGLKVPFRPEGGLDDKARADQRRAIATARKKLEEAVKGAGATEFVAFKTIPYVGLRATPAALGALKTSPMVTSIERDELRPLPPDERTASPASGELKGLASDAGWNLNRVRAKEAWDAGYDGTGQVVAILDTGVQSDHKELANKVTSEACFSQDNGCPNGSPTQVGPGAGAPCRSLDNCAHGTHVAGIAAGARTGVAKGAKVAAIQVFARDGSSAWDTDTLQGLQFVLGLRQEGTPVASANLSLGGGAFTAPCDAATRGKAYADMARNLASVGVAVAAASGNDGYRNAISSPACASTIVSVGNTGQDGSAGEFVNRSSNSASFLFTLAPGTDIVSSVPDNQYASFNGTSMAAPHVAGAIAVLRQFRPKATLAELVSALQTTGTSVTDDKNGIAKPRIDVGEALETLRGGPGPSPTPPKPPGPQPTPPEEPVCSAPGGVKTTILFENRFTDQPVAVFWVDQQCEEQIYNVLEPGQSYTQPTYAGHRWRVRSFGGEVIREVTATESPQTVTVGPGAGAAG